MPISKYLEQAWLNSLFGATAYPAIPANLFFGLSTVAWLGSTDAQILAGEPSNTGGYARISVTNNATNFPAATSGLLGGTASTKTWAAGPGPTGAGSWPISTGSGWSSGANPLQTLFVSDLATLGAGNLLWYGTPSPATDTVNQAGITLYLAASAGQFLLL